MRLSRILVIVFVVCAGRPAQALWFQTESVEWHTNVSDVIVIAEVTATKEIEIDNKYNRGQTVTCKPTDVLKGERPENVTFEQIFSRNTKNHGQENLDG